MTGHRGSWEAGLAGQLVTGTVSHPDESLPDDRAAGGRR